jgi:hypothetical protein
MVSLLAVTFAAIVDPLAFEKQPGPFATLEAACGDGCEFVNKNDDSAFFRRSGDWYVVLRDHDGWFRARLPIQDGVTPGRITEENGVRRVAFSQHAFSRAVDIDADWVWPCVGGACTAQPVPISLRDHARTGEIEIDAQLLTFSSAGRVRVEVLFTRRKIGNSADWRARIEALRGSHSLSLP